MKSKWLNVKDLSGFLSTSLSHQALAGHRRRLGDAEQAEGGGGDVGEDAAIAQGDPLDGGDEGDRVERVGGVGRCRGRR